MTLPSSHPLSRKEPTVADSKIDEAQVGGVTVQTTEATPSNADKTSNPVGNDAKGNQPPVRTNRPDVAVAQTLAAGAGAHEGRVLDQQVNGVDVDADGFDRDGRFVAEPK